jgi:hypothetical protein
VNDFQSMAYHHECPGITSFFQLTSWTYGAAPLYDFLQPFSVASPAERASLSIWLYSRLIKELLRRDYSTSIIASKSSLC